MALAHVLFFGLVAAFRLNAITLAAAIALAIVIPIAGRCLYFVFLNRYAIFAICLCVRFPIILLRLLGIETRLALDCGRSRSANAAATIPRQVDNPVRRRRARLAVVDAAHHVDDATLDRGDPLVYVVGLQLPRAIKLFDGDSQGGLDVARLEREPLVDAAELCEQLLALFDLGGVQGRVLRLHRIAVTAEALAPAVRRVFKRGLQLGHNVWAAAPWVHKSIRQFSK